MTIDILSSLLIDINITIYYQQYIPYIIYKFWRSNLTVESTSSQDSRQAKITTELCEIISGASAV